MNALMIKSAIWLLNPQVNLNLAVTCEDQTQT